MSLSSQSGFSRHLQSHSPRGEEFEIKGSAGLAPSAPVRGLSMPLPELLEVGW